MASGLTEEDLNFIEEELIFDDKVSLLFLLYGHRDPAYVRQLLTVSSKSESNDSHFLIDWKNYLKDEKWEAEVVEALTIIGQNLCLLKCGFDDEELRQRYFPHVAEISTAVHPMLKGLYRFCEMFDHGATCQLIDRMKLQTDELAKDCLEVHLLDLLGNKSIELGSLAQGTCCDMTTLTAACKAAELYDECDALKGIVESFNRRVRNRIPDNQADACSKSSADFHQTVDQKRSNFVPDKTNNALESFVINKTNAGILLIINQFMFHQETNPELKDFLPAKPLKNRRGTEVDKQSLVNTFSSLGYEIVIEENIAHHQIFQSVERAVSRVRPNHSSLIVCLLSHGQEGKVFGANSIPVEVKAIQQLMATESLTGKPKLLIVQACQGSELQSAVQIPQLHELDSPDTEQQTASVFVDFLVAWSTVPGFASVRHIEKGSWFIQEVCQKLKMLYKTEHFMDILTAVINDVSSKRGYGNECMVPIIHSTLSKKLYFDRK